MAQLSHGRTGHWKDCDIAFFFFECVYFGRRNVEMRLMFYIYLSTKHQWDKKNEKSYSLEKIYAMPLPNSYDDVTFLRVRDTS